MKQTFLELLAEIEDFRKGNAIHYRLQDILLVSTLTVIYNIDTYTEMTRFADHQKKYLAPFCDFRHGTPSHDTFGKVLPASGSAARRHVRRRHSREPARTHPRVRGSARASRSQSTRSTPVPV